MSYDTAVSFKIDAKARTITAKLRSSNCFDEWGRRVVDDVKKQFDNENDFKKCVFDLADSALSGSLRFSRTATMSKRLAWLNDHGLLKAEKTDYDMIWKSVKRTEEVYQVLAGIKRVKYDTWLIKSNDGRPIQETRSGVQLGGRGTKFYSIEDAKNFFNELNDTSRWTSKVNWVKKYGLAITKA